MDEAEGDVSVAESAETAAGIQPYVMLDVWVALGGDPAAFDRMWQEPRRTPADTWAQLMAVVRGDLVTVLAVDTNPPCGYEFERLILHRAAGIR